MNRLEDQGFLGPDETTGEFRRRLFASPEYKSGGWYREAIEQHVRRKSLRRQLGRATTLDELKAIITVLIDRT